MFSELATTTARRLCVCKFVWWGGACDDQSLEKSVLSRYTMCFVSLKESDPIYTNPGNLEYHPTIWTRLQGNS